MFILVKNSCNDEHFFEPIKDPMRYIVSFLSSLPDIHCNFLEDLDLPRLMPRNMGTPFTKLMVDRNPKEPVSIN